VADLGFDLGGRGAWTLSTRWGAGKSKSLKKLKVEVKVILECFGHISIKNMLKINLE